MYWKRDDNRIVVSKDGEMECFSFDASALADIAFASAWPGSDSVVLTAARTEDDKASVRANRKGNYRAYRVSGKGIELLTDEYTNTAIALPNEQGIAYSNGNLLVVNLNGARRTYKVGRFSWGPVSLSCSESGNRIAMTKWKGDDRKLACLDVNVNTFAVSRFSYYSYLLFEEDILYVLGGDVMCFVPASSKARSLTSRAIQCQLLDLVGVGARRHDQVLITYDSLSLFQGGAIVIVHVQAKQTYESLWHGIVALPYGGRALDVILAIEQPWRIKNIAATDDTLCLSLVRSETTQPIERRIKSIGRGARGIEAGWRLIADPRIPELGFQFLPED